MAQQIKKCRICGNSELTQILDLGEQALTGIFPKTPTQDVPTAPLILVKCTGAESCGLVQLLHTADLELMYGENYGYRSGLNASMVRHLENRVDRILERVDLKAGDVVIDIGSNDGTTLSFYPKDLNLIGIDPTGEKFRNYYAPHVQLIPDFFSKKHVEENLGGKKVRVITSFSMFYDLEAPMDFMQEVFDCLADGGIWVTEQSYLPTMLTRNSYDTICHEHLEYYSMKQIVWMADRVGFQVVDVEMNDINGGSFAITLKKSSQPHSEIVNKVLAEETRSGIDSIQTYVDFESRIRETKSALLKFLDESKKQGKVVFGYGASTKGNVLLQYCGLTADQLPLIAEVNETKFGSFTPGTLIPILSEAEAKEKKPDYFLILPWHFKTNIQQRETDFLNDGGRLVFPLPHLEFVGTP